MAAAVAGLMLYAGAMVTKRLSRRWVRTDNFSTAGNSRGHSAAVADNEGELLRKQLSRLDSPPAAARQQRQDAAHPAAGKPLWTAKAKPEAAAATNVSTTAKSYGKQASEVSGVAATVRGLPSPRSPSVLPRQSQPDDDSN